MCNFIASFADGLNLRHIDLEFTLSCFICQELCSIKQVGFANANCRRFINRHCGFDDCNADFSPSARAKKTGQKRLTRKLTGSKRESKSLKSKKRKYRQFSREQTQKCESGVEYDVGKQRLFFAFFAQALRSLR
jgi:hypothetical protein